MNKRLYFFCFIQITAVLICRSQDPSFSQFYFNKLYFNPAFSGISRGLEFSFSHRILWPNIPGRFNTTKFSADLDVSQINGLGGIGLIAYKDTEGAGALETIDVGIPFSVRIILNENNYLHFGISASIIQKSIDWSKFVFGDQLNAVLGVTQPSQFDFPSESKLIFPDFSSGIVYEYFNSYRSSPLKDWSFRTGFAVHHMTQPDYSFISSNSRLPMKITAHLNFRIPIGYRDPVILAPDLVYESQAGMKTLYFGSNLIWRSPFMGIWYRRYRNSDAIVMTTGMKLSQKNNVYVSYSYDFTISGLTGSTGGSHEINLLYILDSSSLIKITNKPKRRKIIIDFYCPHF
jgi:type IX secretion system PorP/SprF family membrane protein